MDDEPPYFAIAPDWAAFAAANDIPFEDGDVPVQHSIEPTAIDVEVARQFQEESDQEWAQLHPLDSINYESYLKKIIVRDGTAISVKVTYPSESRLKKHSRSYSKLTVLFVVHGGGYISGSHTSEEAWLVRPLQSEFDLVIVSVEYRLAPEHKFPVWIEDTWDVFEQLLSGEISLLLPTIHSKIDLDTLILAGSSAGAGICAVMSHMCRDRGINVSGLTLNVPMLCEYQHFPTATGISSSYQQCNQGTLGSSELAGCWKAILPSEVSAVDPRVSPLLGQLNRLPQHMIFYPLREDGLEYARKLQHKTACVQWSTAQLCAF